MKPLPTKPVWYLLGRTTEGEVKLIFRYWTSAEAQAALEATEGDLNGLAYTVDESEAVIPDRTVPTLRQLVQLGDFLHRAFVVIRSISRWRTNFEAIERLTDILHNLPNDMFDAGRWDWNSYIQALREFEAEFPDGRAMNLASILENIRDNAEQSTPPNRA